MAEDLDVAVLSLIRTAIEQGSIDLTKSEQGDVFRALLHRLLESRSSTDMLVLADVLEQFGLHEMSQEVISTYESANFVNDPTSPRLRDRLAKELTRNIVFGLDDPSGKSQECLADVKQKLGRMLLHRHKKKELSSLSPSCSADTSPLGQYLMARRSLSPVKPRSVLVETMPVQREATVHEPALPSVLKEPILHEPHVPMTVEEAMKGYVVVHKYKHVPIRSISQWEQQASADLDELMGGGVN